MRKMHKLFSLTLLITMLTSSAYAQEYEAPDEDTTPIAYSEGTNVTRISAYIPVAALILAAIFLSGADRKSRNHSSSSSSSGSHSHSDYYSYYSYYSYLSYFKSGSYSYSGSYSGSNSH